MEENQKSNTFSDVLGQIPLNKNNIPINVQPENPDNLLTVQNKLEDSGMFDSKNWGTYNKQLGKTGVGESQYDKQVNPSNIEGLQNIRYEAQPSISRFANAGMNLLEKTGAYTLQNAGLVLGAPIAALTGDISNMTDNFLVHAGDLIKDQVQKDFPIYKPTGYENTTIWDKLNPLGSSGMSWWLDDAVDRAGLTAGMFLSGGASELAGLGRLGLYGMNIVGQSALNAKETKDGITKTLQDDKSQGKNFLSNEEINQKAAEGAKNAFWETVPLTMAGSLYEIPQMFGTQTSIKTNLNKLFNQSTGEALERTYQPNILSDVIKKSGLTATEHSLNEGLQVAISDYNQNKEQGKDNRGIIPGILGTFIEGIDTPNLQNNLALGFIQGLLMTSGGAIINKSARLSKMMHSKEDLQNKSYEQYTLDKQKEQDDKLFNIINNVKQKRRFYKGDFINRNSDGTIKVDNNGQYSYDQKKLADAGLSLGGIENNLKLKKALIDSDNFHLASILDNDEFTGFVYNFLDNKNGIDHIDAVLKNERDAAEQDPNRLNDLDESGNEITPGIQYNNLLQKAKNLKKIYNDIKIPNLNDLIKSKEDLNTLQNYIDNLKYQQYFEAANQEYLRNTIKKNNNKITSLKLNNDIDILTSTDEVKNSKTLAEHEINDLINKNKTLDNLLNKSIYNSEIGLDRNKQKEGFNDFKNFYNKVKEDIDNKSENKKQEIEKKNESNINGNKEALHSPDIFLQPFQYSADQSVDNDKQIQSILSTPNWKDKIEIKVIKSNKDWNKIHNENNKAIGIVGKELVAKIFWDGKPIYDLDNPNKFVYKNGKPIDFSDMSYAKFQSLFYFGDPNTNTEFEDYKTLESFEILKANWIKANQFNKQLSNWYYQNGNNSSVEWTNIPKDAVDIQLIAPLIIAKSGERPSVDEVSSMNINGTHVVWDNRTNTFISGKEEGIKQFQSNNRPDVIAKNIADNFKGKLSLSSIMNTWVKVVPKQLTEADLSKVEKSITSVLDILESFGTEIQSPEVYKNLLDKLDYFIAYKEGYNINFNIIQPKNDNKGNLKQAKLVIEINKDYVKGNSGVIYLNKVDNINDLIKQINESKFNKTGIKLSNTSFKENTIENTFDPKKYESTLDKNIRGKRNIKFDFNPDKLIIHKTPSALELNDIAWEDEFPIDEGTTMDDLLNQVPVKSEETKLESVEDPIEKKKREKREQLEKDRNKDDDPFTVYNSNSQEDQIQYKLKILDSLQKPKFELIFKRFWNDYRAKFWKEFNSEITQSQINFLNSVIQDKDIKSVDDLKVAILAEMSYTVKINTSTQKDKFIHDSNYGEPEEKTFEYNENIYVSIPAYNNYSVRKFGSQEYKPITKEEYEKVLKESSNREIPTQYYSNLTVPGGTNYTENEIAVPNITPSIKGHAQFSTDNGIGWFRSDEEVKNAKHEATYNPNNPSPTPEDPINEWVKHKYVGESTKTRRILEVQSDLFQKGRDKSNLVTQIEKDESGREYLEPGKDPIDDKDNRNQFLQLLNKNNNWVTFFIKSIIQDSSRKGYEKVLFPSGDTASKVEGHTTLEEFKKQKEDRIKTLESLVDNTNKKVERGNKRLEELEKSKENWKDQETQVGDIQETEVITTENQRLHSLIQTSEEEIEHLQEELQRIETEGFGALKPIYNFYENQVKNILKKNYSINEITDEYGNTWNEIDFTSNTNANQIIVFKSDELFSEMNKENALKYVQETLPSFISVKDITDLFDKLEGLHIPFGAFANNIIYLSENTTPYHEVMHAVIRTLLNDTQIKTILREIEKETGTPGSDKINEFRSLNNQYRYLSNDQVKQLILEDRIAQKFERWKEKKEGSSLMQKFFQKILDFYSWITGKRTKLDKLFNKIDSGDFRDSNIVSNEFSKIGSKGVYKILFPKGAIESRGIINTFVAKLIANKDLSINDLIRNEISLNQIENPINQELMKNMNDSEKNNFIDKLLDEQVFYEDPINQKLIKDQVIKTQKLLYNDINEEEIEEWIEDGKPERLFDRDVFSEGSFDSVSREMRAYISTTLYNTTDKLGRSIRASIDPNSVYASLDQLLSGTSQDKIIPKLIASAEFKPQTKALVERLLGDIGWNQDQNQRTFKQQMLLNRFYKAFEKERVKWMHIAIGNNVVDIYNAQTKDIDKFIFDKWNNVFTNLSIDRKIFEDNINFFLQKLDGIQNENWKYNNLDTNKALVNILNDIGIDINEGTADLSFNPNSALNEIFANEAKITKEHLIQLKDRILKNQNPFLGEVEGVDTGLVGTLLSWARTDKNFREDYFVPNFMDSEGKRRYSTVLPSYALRKARELREELVIEDNINKLKNDPYYSYNTLLQNKKNEDIISTFKNADLAVIGDVRKENKEGVTYKHLDKKSFLAVIHNAFLVEETPEYSHYPLGINETKKAFFAVKLPNDKTLYRNNSISDEFLERVYNTIFKQEQERLKGAFGKMASNDFIYLPILNNKEVDLNNKEEVKNKIKEQFDNEIKQVTEITDQIKNLLDRESINKYGNYESYIGNYVLNYFLNVTGYNQLQTGDDGIFKNLIDKTKRGAGFAAFFNSVEGMQVRNIYTTDSMYTVDSKIDPKESKKESDDGQVYGSIDYFIDFNSQLGRISDTKGRDKDGNLLSSQLDVLKKLKSGLDKGKQWEPNKYELSLLDLISIKDVTYGPDNNNIMRYDKDSTHILTKLETSYYDKKSRKWLALPGKEELHAKREFMEKHNIHRLIPFSATKLQKPTEFIDHRIFQDDQWNKLSSEEVNEKYLKTIDGKYHGLQVENHTKNSKTITTGIQLLHLIDTELEEENKNIANDLHNSLADIHKIAMQQALAQVVNEDYSKKANISKFLDKIRDGIETTTPDVHMDYFLQENAGDMLGDPNLPHIMLKFEQHYLSNFKNALVTLSAGDKKTIVSPAGYNILFDNIENRVISNEEFLNRHNEKNDKGENIFDNNERFIKRRLSVIFKDNNDIDYVEVVTTRRNSELLGASLNEIKDIDPKLLEGIGIRIPTQSHHSMVKYKIVEFLPEYYGATIIAAPEIYYLSGADNDVDSLFTYKYDTYESSGKPVIYGSAKTELEKWNEYKEYQINRNNDVKREAAKIADIPYSDDIEQIITRLEHKFTNEEKRKIAEKEVTGNLIKDILSSEDNPIIQRALRNLGYPSTFNEYKQRGLPDSIGTINNRMIDAMLKILSLPDVQQSLKTPASDSSLDKAANFIFEDLRHQEKSKDSFSTISGLYNMWKNISAGSVNIGPAVNSSLVSAILTKYEIPLNKSFSLNFNSKEYNTFATSKEETRAKADANSTVVSAMTDNGKKPLAYYANLPFSLMGHYGVLLSLGISIENTATLFINQPLIVKIGEQLMNSKSAVEDSVYSKFSIIRDLKKQYGEEAPKDMNISDEEMENAISDNSSKELESKVFHTFLKLDAIAQNFMQVAQVLSLSKGFGASYGALDKIDVALRNLGLDNENPLTEYNKKLLTFDFSKIVNQNANIRTNIQILKQTEKASKNYSIRQTSFFKDIYSNLQNSLKSVLSIDIINDIKGSLQTYLTMKVFVKQLGIDVNKYNDLLHKGTSLMEEFRRLQKDSEFRNNPLIQFLKTKPTTIQSEGREIPNSNNNTGLELLIADSRTKLSINTVEKYIDSYNQLVKSKNKDISDFTKKMIAYLLAKDNLTFKSDSFIKFIAPEKFAQKGNPSSYANLLKKLNKELAKDKVDNAIIKELTGSSKNELQDEFTNIFGRYIKNQSRLKLINQPASNKSDAYSDGNDKQIFKTEYKDSILTISTTDDLKHSGQFGSNTTFNYEQNDKGFITKIKFPDYFTSKETDYITGQVTNTLYKKISDNGFSAKYTITSSIGNWNQSPYHMTESQLENVKIPEIQSKFEEVIPDIDFTDFEDFDNEFPDEDNSTDLDDILSQLPKQNNKGNEPKLLKKDIEVENFEKDNKSFDKILPILEGNKLDVKGALEVLKESDNTLLSSVADKLIQNEKNSNDVKIKLISEDDYNNYWLGNPAYGFYDDSSDTIYIIKESLNKNRFLYTLLHEILHAKSAHEIESNSEIAKQWKELYQYTLNKIGNKDKELYGFTNEHEFLAEIFNKKLVDVLISIPAREDKVYKNLWEEVWSTIKSWMRKFFGFNDQDLTLYDQVFSVATQILDAPNLRENSTGIIKPLNNDSFDEYDEFGNEINNDQKQSEEFVESPFKQQQIFFNKRIISLERRLSNLNPNSKEHGFLLNEINELKTRLQNANLQQSRELFTELGKDVLSKAEDFIKDLEDGKAKDTDSNIEYTKDVLDTWDNFGGLRDQVFALRQRLFTFIEKFTLNQVQEHATEKEPITQETIDSQNKDIGKFTKGVGSLSDVSNFIARTIGSIIKRAQNKASTASKHKRDDIQSEVDKLFKWAKNNGLKQYQIYDVFIQDQKGTTVLTQPYLEDGQKNPNYDKIQETPELKAFYNFYKDTIKEYTKGLPATFDSSFIPNIPKSGIKETLKSLNPVKVRDKNDKVFNEEYLSDVVPLKFFKSISSERKSRDLGNSLLTFVRHSNEFNTLSDILPTVRVLQSGLEYKRNIQGNIVERMFVNRSNPNIQVEGKNSNLYKMVDDIINMQIKGKMKYDEGKIHIKDTFDEEGNPIEQYFDTAGLADDLLHWNSMLRIGFSPVTAVSNVIFGDISNTIEAVGGRFFGIGNLWTATKIFMKQNFNKDSILNKLLEELNPLQELDDYEQIEKGVYSKMSIKKAQEYMYSMQKNGEKYLQSRTLLAVMLKRGYMKSDGTLTDKWNNTTEKEKEELTDLTQRLNQMIHGRYSQREAATLQQSVLYRMAAQFRKWIPASIEARFGSKQYDNRLGVEIEGRYKTFFHLLINLKDTANRIKQGKLTELEVYNMRKNITEVVLGLAAFLMYESLHGGNDDDKKKRRKNPMVKSALTLLNRASGDINLWYNPTNFENLVGNPAPVLKLITDLTQLVYLLPQSLYTGDWKFKRGSRKDDIKVLSKLGNVLPGSKSILDIRRMMNDQALEELK